MSAPLISYPAILPAGAGRRGASSSRVSSPEISAAHTPVKRKLTGVVSVPPARVCSLARANSPGAPASGILSRSPAGASGRNSHQPVGCGGTGCASPSADTLTPSAMTADPRRADPGNPLAGAVSVLRRLPNWPVALRGGGHIAGVV